MSVELDPPELGFRPNDDPVFDCNVKTDTAYGQIQGRSTLVKRLRFKVGKLRMADQDVFAEPCVSVLLQAMREDPPSDARCRDKFLVQTVALSQDSDTSNVPAVWQNIEKASKSSIQERKIRVVFLPADGSNTTPSHLNMHGAHLGDEAPPAYGSPAPSFGSPGIEATTPISRSANQPMHSKGQSAPNGMDSMGTHVQSETGVAASNPTQAIPASADDLRAQLADAKTTISRLTQQAEEQGLRQRKSDAVNQDSREKITTGSTGMDMQQQIADGVPVQIVTALCLFSFLLAYFLF
ncbi:MAG: hypothetical protein Q9222_000593 [Ikaeria aurantiellina]